MAASPPEALDEHLLTTTQHNMISNNKLKYNNDIINNNIKKNINKLGLNWVKLSSSWDCTLFQLILINLVLSKLLSKPAFPFTPI